MVLANHIAHTFLTSDEIQEQILNDYFPEEHKKVKHMAATTAGNKILLDQLMASVQDGYATVASLVFNENILNPRHNKVKTYYVTNTVLDNLKLLKLKRNTAGFYDWTIFKNLESFQKVTFILPCNKMIRMEVLTEVINFCHVEYTKSKTGGAIEGSAEWALFFVNRITGDMSSNFKELSNRKEIDTFLYALLCFVYLAENDEVILQPGKSHGVNKKNKTLNNTNFPVTIINSRWNTTVTTGAFGVSGHFRIYWIGKGRQTWSVKFVEPFSKKGYTRQAKSLTETK